jgi:signal transduction histidine kinase
VVALFDLTQTRRLERVRSDFVANVSHELKTPLTVIGGFAETLLDDDLPIERRRQFVETIRNNAARMQQLVDDLLDLSRIESGGWTPDPVAADLEVLFSEVVAGVQVNAAQKGITVTWELGNGARSVVADVTAIRQIMTNLAGNAVRYTQQGRIVLFSEADSAGVWIGVRDTGMGIPPHHLSRIFERFYRVDPARSRTLGGTGLGLSIVKHLAEAHGGRVRAESVEGRGTTIAVWLPAPPAGASQSD